MSISIILVAPQMGENIGAVARAMKNFDIYDLRIVDPRDGWPNEKAVSMSVGAADLIANARIFGSVIDAISDLSYVYAATATPNYAFTSTFYVLRSTCYYLPLLLVLPTATSISTLYCNV